MSSIERNELLVFGYIRKLEKKLNIMIPKPITELISLYEQISDWFDTEYTKPTDIKVHDDKNMITVLKKNVFVTVYGTRIVKPGESHVWKLHIKKQANRPQDCMWDPYIGIIKNDKDILISNLNELKRFSTPIGYIWTGGKGELANNNNTSHYGETWNKTGNILQLKLDQTDKLNGTISYIINGKDYGVAYTNVIPNDYRLAISFYFSINMQIELL